MNSDKERESEMKKIQAKLERAKLQAEHGRTKSEAEQA